MTKYTELPLTAQIEAGVVGFSSTPVEKSITFTNNSGSGAVGTVDVFSVSGPCMVSVFAVCSGTMTGTGTITLGTVGSSAGFLPSLNNGSLLPGYVWNASGLSTDMFAFNTTTLPQKVIAKSSETIRVTVTTAPVTAGTVKFICSYIPIGDGAKVV